MSRTLPGIPTLYQGRRYRSRLEARYAAFFDALSWPYEYEPIDLFGYVPDFICHPPNASGHVEPMLVEVKPFVPPFEHEDVVLTCARIVEGGWLGDAVVVGAQHRIEHPSRVTVAMHVPALLDEQGNVRMAPLATVPDETTATVCIGRMRDGDDVWRDAYLTRADDRTWQLTHDAAQALLTRTDFFALRLAWSTAGNATQWKAPREQAVPLIGRPFMPPVERFSTCRHGNELRDCDACDSGDRDR